MNKLLGVADTKNELKEMFNSKDKEFGDYFYSKAGEGHHKFFKLYTYRMSSVEKTSKTKTGKQRGTWFFHLISREEYDDAVNKYNAQYIEFTKELEKEGKE